MNIITVKRGKTKARQGRCDYEGYIRAHLWFREQLTPMSKRQRTKRAIIKREQRRTVRITLFQKGILHPLPFALHLKPPVTLSKVYAAFPSSVTKERPLTLFTVAQVSMLSIRKMFAIVHVHVATGS